MSKNKAKLSKDYVPVRMSLKDVVQEYAIELTNDQDTLTLLESIRTVLESGVDKLTLKVSDKFGRVIVDEDCYKNIDCRSVKAAKISDKGHFDSKTDAKLHIETSEWYFPCPSYLYSDIKRNLETAISKLTGIAKVEVKSFSTGIVEYN